MQMTDSQKHAGRGLTRSQVLRGGSVILAGAAIGLPLAAPTPAQANAGIAGANGINPADYVGGDGSYQRYLQDGIKLGFNPNPGNLADPAPGKASGWNTDIVLEALKRVGLTKYEFVAGPWETMVPGLQSSRFDLLMSDVHVTAQRVQIIDFTTPVYWYGDILVVPKGNPANVHSWADLAGKRVGVVRGYNYADMLAKRTDLGNLVQYPDDFSAVTDAAAGRVDALIAGDPNFVALKQKNPDLQVDVVNDYVPQSNGSDWTRYGIRKGENDLNNVVSHALGEMFIDGTILSVLRTYGFGTRNLFIVKGL